MVISDRLLHAERGRIVELAARHRLPTVYGQSLFTDVGGLLCYGPGRVDRFRRAAVYVDRILRGAKPADLPIERPTTFEQGPRPDDPAVALAARGPGDRVT